MSFKFFTDIAGKAENFLNKIDEKTANVLNTSNDLISNSSLANSQSLPQLKSIFISNDPATDLEFRESEFKYGHSRDSSTASYHGIVMKDTTTTLNNKYNNKLQTTTTI